MFFLFATLMGILMVLGWVRGSWRYVMAVAALFGLAAVFAVPNDGWYGAGWGENGVCINLLAGGVMLAGPAAGVVLHRRYEARS